jgi:NAD-dependent deacetylase
MQEQYAVSDTQGRVREAASLIRFARHLTAFTGAGVSVESGIPPFRGEGGLWSRYDPRMLELDYFLAHPETCWPVIREIFYDHFGAAKPNRAHEVLAAWEARGLLKCLITQNIDNLHTLSGSCAVAEFHGSSRELLCLACGRRAAADPVLLEDLPPRCSCGGLLKPDFIFFGEGIPGRAFEQAREAARLTDVMLVIGSTGEVYPAALLPRQASDNGAAIIEINPRPSGFTAAITDIHITLGAAAALELIDKELFA